MAPDINPIYAGLERSCPRDSKNVSYAKLDTMTILTIRDKGGIIKNDELRHRNKREKVNHDELRHRDFELS